MRLATLALVTLLALSACGDGGFSSARCEEACQHTMSMCGMLPMGDLDDCLDLCSSIAAGTMECTGIDATIDCALASSSCPDLVSSCDLNFDCVGTTTPAE